MVEIGSPPEKSVNWRPNSDVKEYTLERTKIKAIIPSYKERYQKK